MTLPNVPTREEIQDGIADLMVAGMDFQTLQSYALEATLALVCSLDNAQLRELVEEQSSYLYATYYLEPYDEELDGPTGQTDAD
jgi:hypothetical protein